eukprot:6203284-Amphidinium_carterae.1
MKLRGLQSPDWNALHTPSAGNHVRRLVKERERETALIEILLVATKRGKVGVANGSELPWVQGYFTTLARAGSLTTCNIESVVLGTWGSRKLAMECQSLHFK